MSFRQYRYFVEVAELLSFSRAAERLHVSQSALSRQIQLFEADLGLKLFDRIGRTVALTPAGRDLFPRCQSVLSDSRAIALRADDLASGASGFVRVGATPPSLQSVVAHALPAFRQQHPKIEIVLTENSAAQLTTQLDGGHLDLAVMGMVAAHLTGFTLATVPLIAIVPPSHRFLGKERLDVTELANEAVLLLKNQYVSRQVFDSACYASSVRSHIVFESGNPHSLLALAHSGLGIAVVPSNMLIGSMLPGSIPLDWQGEPLHFSLSVVWNPRRYRSPSADKFMAQLRTHCICAGGDPYRN